jgi:hypothetical protein
MQHPDYNEGFITEDELIDAELELKAERLEDEMSHGIRCECPDCEDQPILGEG